MLNHVPKFVSNNLNGQVRVHIVPDIKKEIFIVWPHARCSAFGFVAYGQHLVRAGVPAMQVKLLGEVFYIFTSKEKCVDVLQTQRVHQIF